MTSPDSKTIGVPTVAFSFLLLFLTLFVYLILIPPFQNPDEVQHFGEILSRLYPETEYPVVEKELLHLMWQHQWFVFVGMGQPDRPPDNFKSVKFLQGYELGAFEKKNATTFYHGIYAFLLRPFKNARMLFLFYICRMFSLLFTFASLLIIFNCLKTRYPKDLLALFGFFLMIPQFLIVGVSVNYEIFSIFFGTLFFVSLIKIRHQYPLKWVVALTIGLLGSLVSKNSGGIFIVFLVLSLIVIKFDLKKILYSLGALGGIFLIFAWINYLFPGKILVLYKYVFSGITQCSETFLTGGDFFSFTGFMGVMARSFYAKLGWMAYEIGWIWYGLFFTLVVLSIPGYLLLYRKKGEIRFFIYAGMVFFIQVLAIWVYYGLRGILAQGRYLFPFMVLFIYLVVSGLNKLDIRFFKDRMVLLKGLALLNIGANLYIILFKIIPIFYLAYQSPRGGV